MNRFVQDLLTASNWFFRSLRHGDWLWLILAIIIASLSVSVIKQVGDSIQLSMINKAANSLGADLVIQSSRPIDKKYQQLAKSFSLETRKTLSIVTMAFANEQFQLISLKGVSSPNPLRLPAGQKPIAMTDQSSSDLAVWLEPKLMQLLNLKTGDQITLGTENFSVKGALTPNSLINPMSQFAPQAQLQLTQLQNIGLLGPGSRANYELQVRGTESNVLAFQQEIEKRLEQAKHSDTQLPWTLISAKAPSEDLGKTLDRAWFFLDLASLSAVLIAGMSILIASRFYLSRWQNTMALLRAYGANNKQMRRLFAGQLFWLSFFSSLIGAAIGLLMAWGLSFVLQDFFEPYTQSSPWRALLIGAVSGMLVLWSFAWQALVESLKTSPMKLLRAVPKPQNWFNWFISFMLLVFLITLMVGLERLIWVLAGLTLLSITLWISASALVWFLQKTNHSLNGWKKIAVTNLLKDVSLLKVQLISVGVVLFVLLLMTFVRQDLLQTWQSTLPENAPNTFIMNVQPDQKSQVEDVLSSHKVKTQLVPMIKGRLIAKNQQPMNVQDQTSPRAQRLLQREANIGILETPPEHNQIIERANPSDTVGADNNLKAVSIEQGIAELLGIKLGDQLTFDFQGEKQEYLVKSIRQVEWQSFQLNFFFIIEPFANAKLEDSLAISYIGNFFLDEQADTQIKTATQLTQVLAQQTPGVLLIDVSSIMIQIKDIMDQASWAVTGLYGFTLVASLLVLFTATLASQQSRLQGWFLLRSLGATQSIITKVGMSEFVLTGLLAGGLAATLAQLSSWFISTQWLDRASPFSWSLWLSSLVLGVAILLLIAWLTQRQYLKLSTLKLKRIVQS